MTRVKKIIAAVIVILFLLFFGYMTVVKAAPPMVLYWPEDTESSILDFTADDVESVEAVIGRSEPYEFTAVPEDAIEEIVAEIQSCQLLGEKILKSTSWEDEMVGGGIHLVTFYLKNGDVVQLRIVMLKENQEKPEENVLYVTRLTNGEEDFAYNQDWLFRGPAAAYFDKYFEPTAIRCYV